MRWWQEGGSSMEKRIYIQMQKIVSKGTQPYYYYYCYCYCYYYYYIPAGWY